MDTKPFGYTIKAYICIVHKPEKHLKRGTLLNAGHRPAPTWFLKTVFVDVYVCVCMCVCMCACVCVPPGLLITSGVMWTPYDWLNKSYSFM